MSSHENIKIRNRDFDSLIDAAEFFNIPISTIARRQKMGWSLEQTFGLEDAPSNSRNTEDLTQLDLISHAGKIFSSVNDFAINYNLDPELVRQKLFQNMSGSQIIEESKITLKSEITIRLDGKQFKTPSDLAKYYNANASMVSARLEKGWSPAQSVGLMPKPESEDPYQDVVSLVVDGNLFSSINEIAVKYKLQNEALIKLVSNGTSPQEAVENLLADEKDRINTLFNSEKKAKPVISDLVDSNLSTKSSSNKVGKTTVVTKKSKLTKPIEKVIEAQPIDDISEPIVVEKPQLAIEPVLEEKKYITKQAELIPTQLDPVEPQPQSKSKSKKSKTVSVKTTPIKTKAIKEDRPTASVLSTDSDIIVDGVKYGSKFQVAKRFNITPTLFYKRINAGDTAQEAVDYFAEKMKALVPEQIGRRGRPGKSVDYDGKTFASVRDFAKYYNIDPHKIAYRLGKSWTLAQSVDHERRDELPTLDGENSIGNREIQFENKIYRSIRSLANTFKISPHKVRYRLKNGWSLAQAVEKDDAPINANSPKGQAKSLKNISDLAPFIVDGIVFPTAKALAQHYGANVAKITGRLRNGWSPDEAVGLAKMVHTHKNTKPDVIKPATNPEMVAGKQYRSIFEVAKVFDVNVNIINKRLLNGWTIEQAVGLENQPEAPLIDTVPAKQVSIASLAPFEIDGMVFETAKTLASHYKLDSAKITGRLRNGWSVSQAVELESHKRGEGQIKKYQVGDRMFANAVELAEAFDITYRVVNYRLTQGASPAQAVGLEPWKASAKKGKKVEFDGTTYSSLINLAKAYGIEYSKLVGRIHRGWDLERALNVKPKNTLMSNPSKSKASLKLAKDSKKTSSVIKNLIKTISKEQLKLGRKQFDSVEDFAAYINVDPIIASRRLNDGWTTKQIAGKELPPNW